jgi:hypothetical protein
MLSLSRGRLPSVSAAAVPWPIYPLPAKGPPVCSGLEALAAHSLCGRLQVFRAVVMVKHPLAVTPASKGPPLPTVAH